MSREVLARNGIARRVIDSGTFRTTAGTDANRRAARGLGFASLAIAALELAIPTEVERLLGVAYDGRYVGVLRLLGLRELMHGIDLLSHDDPRPGVYARVVGDGLDGVLLLAAARRTHSPKRFAAAAALVMGVVVADLVLAGRLRNKAV
jgi:hypothetical protein